MELEEARELARELMSDYGLWYWRFNFNKAKTMFGYCDERTKEISLSEPLVLLNNDEVVKNVILHEITHALVGCNHHHNQIFQEKAKKIGCEYIYRCCPEDVVFVPKNIVAKCKFCGNEVRKYRMPSRKKICGKCYRVYNKKYLLEFKRLPQP